MTWREAVEAAVRRVAAKSGDGVFTRQELLDAEQDRITSDCGGGGETPEQTISRVLQEYVPMASSRSLMTKEHTG